MRLCFLWLVLCLPVYALEPALETLYDWQLLRPDGSELSISELVQELADTEVVFIGEYHGHPAVHLFQLKLLQALHRDNPNLVLSMEQFSRDKQAVVDSYLAGELGERRFTRQSNAWPNYHSYRPLIELARQHQLPVIAANAPRSIVRCVGRLGPGYLEQLSAEQRAWAADTLHLDTPAYKVRFMDFFSQPNSPQDSESLARLERRFAAQVTWDDTMAESIVLAMRQNSQRKVVHLAGTFHVEYHQGTVERVKRREPQTQLVVIAPLQVTEAAVDQTKWSELGDYILQVQPMPPRYLSSESMPQHPMVSHERRGECSP